MFDVLLIDDEKHITASIKKTIPWHAIEVDQVFEAQSAEEAFQILDIQNIDIVISDIRMPGMNGLELVDNFKQKWPNIRFIFLTGFADFNYAQRAVQLKAFDYLLKPVKDEDLIRTISSAIDVLKDEWKEEEKVHTLSYNLKSNYQVLISNLFHDLLLGRIMTNNAFEVKLKQYETSIKVNEETLVILFQFKDVNYDEQSLALLEYAVANIATEIFANQFNVLHSETPHHGAILLLQFSEKHSNYIHLSAAQKEKLVSEKIELLQMSVSNYLKMNISFIVSDWFIFPQELANEYRSLLSNYYSVSNKQSITYQTHQQMTIKQRIHSLDSLYKPPTFINLLESKQWDTAREKLEEIFHELTEYCTIENLYEVYFSVTNTFLYVAHKQGQVLSQIDQLNYDLLMDRRLLNSVEKLKEWTFSILYALQINLSETDQYTRKYIISKVQSLLANRIGEDVSLKTIADSVNFHPVYLSKVYKMETGEGLSDYIIRMKMERAMYMLKHGNKKIYEITEELGYQNPQSFRKMFRKHFNMSPNEFRDS